MRLCTGRTDQRGRRGIALLFLDHGTRWGCGVSVPNSLYVIKLHTHTTRGNLLVFLKNRMQRVINALDMDTHKYRKSVSN